MSATRRDARGRHSGGSRDAEARRNRRRAHPHRWGTSRRCLPARPLPTGAECAKRIHRAPWEPKPKNDEANHTVRPQPVEPPARRELQRGVPDEVPVPGLTGTSQARPMKSSNGRRASGESRTISCRAQAEHESHWKQDGGRRQGGPLRRALPAGSGRRPLPHQLRSVAVEVVLPARHLSVDPHLDRVHARFRARRDAGLPRRPGLLGHRRPGATCGAASGSGTPVSGTPTTPTTSPTSRKSWRRSLDHLARMRPTTLAPPAGRSTRLCGRAKEGHALTSVAIATKARRAVSRRSSGCTCGPSRDAARLGPAQRRPGAAPPDFAPRRGARAPTAVTLQQPELDGLGQAGCRRGAVRRRHAVSRTRSRSRIPAVGRHDPGRATSTAGRPSRPSTRAGRRPGQAATYRSDPHDIDIYPAGAGNYFIRSSSDRSRRRLPAHNCPNASKFFSDYVKYSFTIGATGWYKLSAAAS